MADETDEEWGIRAFGPKPAPRQTVEQRLEALEAEHGARAERPEKRKPEPAPEAVEQTDEEWGVRAFGPVPKPLEGPTVAGHYADTLVPPRRPVR